MKRVLSFLLLFLLTGSALMLPAEDLRRLPAQDFLLRARRSNPVATYARLFGVLQHKRKGQDVLTFPIYFGVILHPERTVGQIVLDNKEGYLLGQAKGEGVTSVTPMPENKSDLLGYVGVRASDLTMSFLFCPLKEEMAGETVGGLVPCRILLLDDAKNSETVKVWISAEHAFPLQAEFTRYGEKEPYRLLEASGFSKKNDLYYVQKIRLEGPGWRTRIDFEKDSALVALFDPKDPPAVMMRLNVSK